MTAAIRLVTVKPVRMDLDPSCSQLGWTSSPVVRHPLHPHLSEVVPYVAAVIELDGTQGAGARMTGNVTDCDPDAVTVGDRVEIWFDRVSDTYALPRFRPVPE